MKARDASASKNGIVALGAKAIFSSCLVFKIVSVMMKIMMEEDAMRTIMRTHTGLRLREAIPSSLHFLWDGFPNYDDTSQGMASGFPYYDAH